MTDGLYAAEAALRSEGYALVCGLDEAGRGPLAGPVYAAAVILPEGLRIDGLDDSKKLSAKKRDAVFDRICASGAAFSVASASPGEIEDINILEASLLAMRRAADALALRPDILLVDGNISRGFSLPARHIIKGDSTCACIAAASVLAKVSRDRHMELLAQEYPGYGFEKHRGYGTKAHIDALKRLGPCPCHRPYFLKKPLGKASPEDKTGLLGEDAAARLLEARGYRILARRYRTRRGELDLVAEKEGAVAFVEVKSRTGGAFARPLDAVDEKKRRKLRLCASEWLAENASVAPCSFIVAEVFFDRGEPLINLIEDAF